MEKNKGAEGNPGGRGAPIVRLHDETTQTPTLSDLGISKVQSYRWQLEAEIPEDRFEQFIAVPLKRDSPTGRKYVIILP